MSGHLILRGADGILKGVATELAHSIEDGLVDGSGRIVAYPRYIIVKRTSKLTVATSMNRNNLGSSLTGALNDGGAGGPGLGGAVMGVYSSYARGELPNRARTAKVGTGTGVFIPIVFIQKAHHLDSRVGLISHLESFGLGSDFEGFKVSRVGAVLQANQYPILVAELSMIASASHHIRAGPSVKLHLLKVPGLVGQEGLKARQTRPQLTRFTIIKIMGVSENHGTIANQKSRTSKVSLFGVNGQYSGVVLLLLG